MRGGSAGPFVDLEVIRSDAGMPPLRFCSMIGVPERTWRRWQAKTRGHKPPKGPWLQPVRQGAKRAIVKHAAAHTA